MPNIDAAYKSQTTTVRRCNKRTGKLLSYQSVPDMGINQNYYRREAEKRSSTFLVKVVGREK